MTGINDIHPVIEEGCGDIIGPEPLVTLIPRDVLAFHVVVGALEPVDEILSIPPGGWAIAGGRRARVTRSKKMVLSLGDVYIEMKVRKW